MGRLTGADDGVHPALTWSYDGQGNLLTVATGGITTTYSYSTTATTANELTGLVTPGQATRYYVYDPYGNTLSIGPSPNQAPRTYDPNPHYAVKLRRAANGSVSGYSVGLTRSAIR